MFEATHLEVALINLDSAIRRAIRTLAKLSSPRGLELLTYKRNRGVAILKLESGQLEVRERGYRDERHVIDEADLPKLLRSIAKREFPRSRKVRLALLDGPGDVARPLKKL